MPDVGSPEQVAVTNQAYGLALTAEYDISQSLTAKLIASDRHSEYSAGLDDDSFFDNVLTFPEDGFADQTSLELQLNGAQGKVDFVSGLYYFTEDGENSQIPNIFLGAPGTYVISQELDSYAASATACGWRRGFATPRTTRTPSSTSTTSSRRRASATGPSWAGICRAPTGSTTAGWATPRSRTATSPASSRRAPTVCSATWI